MGNTLSWDAIVSSRESVAVHHAAVATAEKASSDVFVWIADGKLFVDCAKSDEHWVDRCVCARAAPPASVATQGLMVPVSNPRRADLVYRFVMAFVSWLPVCSAMMTTFVQFLKPDAAAAIRGDAGWAEEVAAPHRMRHSFAEADCTKDLPSMEIA